MNAGKALQIIKNEIYADGKERAEAMRAIEEAVGKQVEKDAFFYDWWHCPECGYDIEPNVIDNKEISFCGCCGQKLNMNEVREEQEKWKVKQ